VRRPRGPVRTGGGRSRPRWAAHRAGRTGPRGGGQGGRRRSWRDPMAGFFRLLAFGSLLISDLERESGVMSSRTDSPNPASHAAEARPRSAPIHRAWVIALVA